MSDVKSNLSSASPGSLRELAIVALPLVLSNGSLSLMYFLDRAMLTQYSEAALAASMPATALHFMVMSLAMGTVGYANTFVAQYDGSNQTTRVSASVWQAIYVSILASFPLMILGLFAGPIFSWIDHASEVQHLEVDYFTIMCLGSFPFIAATAVSCYFSGRGRALSILLANVLMSITNITLDYVLIFGIGPFPRMGVTGAAIATVIAGFVQLTTLLLAIRSSRDGQSYQFFANFRFDRDLFFRLLRFGAPSGVTQFLEVVCFSMFILLVGRLGTRELAATNMAFSLNTLAFVPMIGLGIAVMTIVGQRIGEKRPDLAATTVWKSFGLAVIYMTVFACIYLFLPDQIIAPFRSEEQTEEEFQQLAALVTLLLQFVAIYSIFDAAYLIFQSALRGAGDVHFPMIYSLVTGMVFAVFPTWVSQAYFGGNILEAWYAITAWVIMLGGGLLLRFRLGYWKTMQVIEITENTHDQASSHSDLLPAVTVNSH